MAPSSCVETMTDTHFNVGDLFVYCSRTCGDRSIVTIIDYPYDEYYKKHIYVLEHRYISPTDGISNIHIERFSSEEEILENDAYKHYTYYPVVKQ
jgi:hypothetical protein